MKNPEELIGRKVRGFKFEKDSYLVFTNQMKKYIGVVGVIKSYDGEDNAFNVFFDDENYFSYPADQIEAHLVEEEIPTLSDGVMMLVSDDNETWAKRKVLCKFKSIYVAVNEVNNKTITEWSYCKPLEPTKEEQLTAILGSSEKVAEIIELFKNE